MPARHFMDCLAAIMRERDANSRIALRATVKGGDGFAFVPDFESHSRSAQPGKR
jgi:hypothetical protein